MTVRPCEPIGVFDSGLGGLTVARALLEGLPQESILYVGDTKRCPYGPRDQAEVRDFACEIVAWLVERKVKMIVIACNTATAASLEVLQHELNIPVIGVIEPGARAAVNATRTGNIGVLATQGTVQSMSYVRALQKLDPDARITQCAAPRFVELVEDTLAHARKNIGVFTSELFDAEHAKDIVRETLEPLQGQGIDTVVLGCTHFPMLSKQIQEALGSDVVLVNPAEETTRSVQHALSKLGELAEQDEAGYVQGAGEKTNDAAQTTYAQATSSQQHPHHPQHHFATTSDEVDEFAHAGSLIFGEPLGTVKHITLSELDHLLS